MESVVRWTSGLRFDVTQDGAPLVLDGDPAAGELRPKALLLSALGGCSGMDVVGILEKMRIPLESLKIEVQAEQTEEHPRVFTGIRIRYVFRGESLPQDKLERAVRLSQEQYCGVWAMLGKAVPITWEILTE